MRPPRGPRLVRRLLVALPAVATLLLAPAVVPAAAAPAAGVGLRFRDVTLAPGGSQGLSAVVYAQRPTPLTGGVLNLRLSDNLTGVLLLGTGTPGPCGQDASKTMQCTLSPITVRPGAAGTRLDFVGYIGAGADAVPGTVGSLSVTLTADNLAPVTTTAVVRVGDAVDLDATAEVELTAAPGASFGVPLRVRNDGPIAADGAAILLRAPYSFAAGQRYRNCFYDGDQLRACTFDQDLAPGASYRATLPTRLRPDTYAPSTQYAQTEWMTSDEFTDLRTFLTNGDYQGLGRPGTGGVLTLTPTATAAASAQADPDASDNTAFLQVAVTGRKAPNLVAVGARLTAKPGDVVTAGVGVRNAGPATLDGTQVPGGSVWVFVSIPVGTTATAVPDTCYPLVDGGISRWDGSAGKPGRRQYECLADPVLVAGRTQTFPIRLRVTAASVTPGVVEVNRPCRGCDDLFVDESPKSDNKAAITVRAPAGAGTGGDGQGSGAGGDGQGAGGGLPITGPASGAIGAVGLALLLTGVAGVVLGRRRRTG
ncbi:hypothetical protein [Jidongwangia harbinensis]|uniref:hypothetical protein n=1 Tax=Jidongwangia harbinensis TaxID=2878561 RepID=UPI001CD9926B|nr:hypothetical protein [Jidongwangia harbinensis]MCA2218925.1 hypothetical protein [Jidongwangia harbinensis]